MYVHSVDAVKGYVTAWKGMSSFLSISPQQKKFRRVSSVKNRDLIHRQQSDSQSTTSYIHT